jgi:hypothetical protein
MISLKWSKSPRIVVLASGKPRRKTCSLFPARTMVNEHETGRRKGTLILVSGHVADIFRKGETKKMANWVEVRSHNCPPLARAHIP